MPELTSPLQVTVLLGAVPVTRQGGLGGWLGGAAWTCAATQSESSAAEASNADLRPPITGGGRIPLLDIDFIYAHHSQYFAP
jgi:hypothetical protein